MELSTFSTHNPFNSENQPNINHFETIDTRLSTSQHFVLQTSLLEHMIEVEHPCGLPSEQAEHELVLPSDPVFTGHRFCADEPVVPT